jgi:acyl-coenzyme A thioesterase PaaI-like protein
MSSHIFSELGWNVRNVGDEVHGAAEVIAPLLAGDLRVSVLAAWADHLMGLVAAQIVAPRVPATLELDVQLLARAPTSGRVHGRGRLLKSGRSVVFAAADFFDAHDRRFAIAGGSFMLAGDPDVRLPPKLSLDLPDQPARLTMPFAERAGCILRAPGVAALERREDGLNSSNTINGGLLALAAEEALRSLYEGHSLCSLALRYVRPCRVGPAVAVAERHGSLGTVETRDEGSSGRLAVVGSARAFEAR